MFKVPAVLTLMIANLALAVVYGVTQPTESEQSVTETVPTTIATPVVVMSAPTTLPPTTTTIPDEEYVGVESDQRRLGRHRAAHDRVDVDRLHLDRGPVDARLLDRRVGALHHHVGAGGAGRQQREHRGGAGGAEDVPEEVGHRPRSGRYWIRTSDPCCVKAALSPLS